MNKAVVNQDYRIILYFRDVATRVPLQGVSASDITLLLRKSGDPLSSSTSIPLTDGVDFFEISDMSGVYEVVIHESFIDEPNSYTLYVGETPISTFTSEAIFLAFEAVSETIEDKVARVLGLVQENMKTKNHVYDPNGNLVSSEILLFESPSDLSSETNPIATYNMAASYDGDGNLQTYEVVKV